MDYVFNASKLDGVVNKSVFDGTENYDEVIASDEEDLQLVNSDSDAVDNMMREFGRDNAIKGSFDKIVSDDVKYLFNSIVNLESADSRIIDTNNPLGVPTRMNYREVMQTLINKADKSSIDNFIESIKDIAYKDRSKAGLINLYDILKNNSNLANKIYTQLIFLISIGIKLGDMALFISSFIFTSLFSKFITFASTFESFNMLFTSHSIRFS